MTFTIHLEIPLVVHADYSPSVEQFDRMEIGCAGEPDSVEINEVLMNGHEIFDLLSQELLEEISSDALERFRSMAKDAADQESQDALDRPMGRLRDDQEDEE